jgi:hypothetical protein
MRLSNFTPSKLVYALATETYLLEYLGLEVLHQSVTVNKEVMLESQGKA